MQLRHDHLTLETWHNGLSCEVKDTSDGRSFFLQGEGARDFLDDLETSDISLQNFISVCEYDELFTA